MRPTRASKALATLGLSVGDFARLYDRVGHESSFVRITGIAESVVVLRRKGMAEFLADPARLVALREGDRP